MSNDNHTAVKEAFPELAEIEDEDLRTGVIEAWARALEASGDTDLDAVPWFPPEERRLDIKSETLVAHVRDVTAGALALCDILRDRRNAAVSRDLVAAGALCHDVSKLYEFEDGESTEIETLLGHPHYGVHAVAVAGLPVEIMHIALSHSGRTAVEPAFIEAEIVRRADEVAAAAIRSTAVDDLRTI
ncbi:MAG: HD domain-containing protein [Halobacteriales archaeon]